VINWMLGVDDVEDVGCTVVDDMETRERSQFLVQRGWSEGKDKGTKAEMMEGVTVLGARLWRLPRGQSLTGTKSQILRHHLARLYVQYQDHRLQYCTYCRSGQQHV
jgi:hypothetical protein